MESSCGQRCTRRIIHGRAAEAGEKIAKVEILLKTEHRILYATGYAKEKCQDGHNSRTDPRRNTTANRASRRFP